MPCIDRAVRVGALSFWDVLDIVLTEMCVERAAVAEEASAQVLEQSVERLEADQITHEALKALSTDAGAVVRTGETVPYTNVVLVSCVVFCERPLNPT